MDTGVHFVFGLPFFPDIGMIETEINETDDIFG
jgi:hypothetical protein